jgi:hypothetical protein
LQVLLQVLFRKSEVVNVINHVVLDPQFDSVQSIFDVQITLSKINKILRINLVYDTLVGVGVKVDQGCPLLAKSCVDREAGSLV